MDARNARSNHNGYEDKSKIIRNVEQATGMFACDTTGEHYSNVDVKINKIQKFILQPIV